MWLNYVRCLGQAPELGSVVGAGSPTETTSVLQIRLSLWKDDSLPRRAGNTPQRRTLTKGVHILAQTQSLIKENPVSERQKLDWQTETEKHTMMGLDVGRMPQVGAEAAGQTGDGQFFTHSWVFMGKMAGEQDKKGNVVRALFACVGREVGPD